MNCTTYYHGTNDYLFHKEDITVSGAINGAACYMTLCLDTAKLYGGRIISYVVPTSLRIGTPSQIDLSSTTGEGGTEVRFTADELDVLINNCINL